MKSDKYGLVDILIIVAFLIGLLGNITALWILHKTAKRRNKKHLFMLRCLAMNDIVAQLGMLLFTNVMKNRLLPYHYICVGFVIFRGFGLGSGCVAFVMALERWLALTRPFLYHQLVTYRALKRFMITFWCCGVILCLLPLTGFGLYYDKEKNKCERFRYAVEYLDKIYAYLFFTFGASLCLCIVVCNTSVIWELCRIKTQHKIIVRRISRSIINNRVGCARYQTPEEIAFAKLMAFVCIIFVICWSPQIISVPISQMFPKSESINRYAKAADSLLNIYFTLDPFVYVLQNYSEGRLTFNCCSFKRSTSSLSTATTVSALPNNNVQTQETVFIAECEK